MVPESNIIVHTLSRVFSMVFGECVWGSLGILLIVHTLFVAQFRGKYVEISL